MSNQNKKFMRKSYLLGGALLAAALFVTTSCKEVMGSLDNPVKSYLEVIGEAPVIGVGETYTIEKDKNYTTISDAAAEFAVDESSTGMVEVDKFTGEVTALKSGDAKINISLPNNGIYLDDVASFTIKVRIDKFTDLKNELTATGVTEVKAYLADDANIVWEGDDMIDVSGKKVAIIGGANTTMVVKKGFQIDNDFAISNVKMDFSDQGSYFVGFLNATEEVVKIGDITFENIEAKNMKQPLFKSNKSNYLMNNISIINSVVEMGSNKNVIDLSSGSSAYNVNFENSTIYASVSHTTGMFKNNGGQGVRQIEENGTQTFNFTNCTIYGLAYGKNFFDLNTKTKGQSFVKYNVKNNIFVNCGKNGQTIVGLNHGQVSSNPTWSVDGNVFNYNGSDTSGAEVTKAGKDSNNKDIVQNSIAKVVTFKDAANGDFTQSDVEVGDPRWKTKK